MITTLTIFTPSYNRAYILGNLYESLKRQSNKNFIWLIVDDGSTDDTQEIVNSWIKEGVVSIEYIKQENRGKMEAHNVGVINCKTEMFLCVDSDDFLLDDTVEAIMKCRKEISQENICGILAKRFFPNLKDIPFPHKDAISLFDLYYNGFRGDTSLVFFTSVLKKFLFPCIKGEKFLTESYVYDQISAKGYEFQILDRSLIVCEYQSDGYTNNIKQIHRKYPEGYIAYQKQHIELFYERMSFINKIKAKGIFVSCMLFKTKSMLKIYREIPRKGFFLTSLLAGLYLYIKINR